MKILVTGCLHGEWDLLCDTVEGLLQKGKQIDLIIVTGDAQTMRTEEDMKSIAVPAKYKRMGSFHKLYNGERRIPRPTIVVGGNHESSDFLYLLPFGGWLAPDVFYVGRASSLLVGDVTISSISGLYKQDFYYEKVNEKYPIRSGDDLQKCYHIRAFSDFQLLGLDNTKIMLSHDWPSGIPKEYGGSYLQRRKNTLIESDQKNTFGLDKGLEMIEKFKPSIWFASHHHVYFRADVEETSFVAFPKTTIKHWYDIYDIENSSPILPLKYRGEWISILKATSAEMENPNVLRNVDWNDRMETIKQRMEKVEDCQVGYFELNPYEYTSKFCEDHNIYCPVKEIRDYMEKKKIPKF